MDFTNLDRLRRGDEVKFVVADRRDFDWACRVVRRHKLCERGHAVLASPVEGKLAATKLASWVVKSGLAVRVQLQLHKALKVQ